MVKHVWSVMAERICRDQDDDSISYLAAIEEVYTDELPVTQDQMFLGSRWHKFGETPEFFKFRISVVLPDESQTVLMTSPKLKFSIKNVEYRTTMGLGGYEFKQRGRHIFQVEQLREDKWVLVAELPIMLREVTKEKKASKKKSK
jgi:hypothetical protein